jgi:phenylacetate-CoA ligase
VKQYIYNTYHKYIKRDELHKWIPFYDDSQYWERERLIKLQWDRTCELVSYAYENVPYYRELFRSSGVHPSDIQHLDAFSQIPLLTKQIIRENNKDLIATGIEKTRMEPNSTSGSTGENIYFYNDKTFSIHKTALETRLWSWMDVGPGDRKMTIWGAPLDVSSSQKTSSTIKKWLKSMVFLSGYNLTKEDVVHYIDLMNRFKPLVIWSYPSILHHISQIMIDEDLAYSPRAIRTGGEKLFPFQRELIEKVFQTRVFDFYGARDMRCVAQECNKHKGLHVNVESVLLEVVDEDGNPIKEGEGEIVVTDLHNRVMPFIRYKIGDRARISSRRCECGRDLPLIEEVVGRSFDLIEFPNGNMVSGTFWTLLFRSRPGINRFQVVQFSPEKVIIRYQPTEAFQEEFFNFFTKEIHKYSGDELKIDYFRTDDFPLTRGGKFQFVITEVNNPGNSDSA